MTQKGVFPHIHVGVEHLEKNCSDAIWSVRDCCELLAELCRLSLQKCWASGEKNVAKCMVAMTAEEKVQVPSADGQDMKASCKEEDGWRTG